MPKNSGLRMQEGARNDLNGQWFRFTNMLAGPVFLDTKRASDALRLAAEFVMPGESSVLSAEVSRIAVNWTCLQALRM